MRRARRLERLEKATQATGPHNVIIRTPAEFFEHMRNPDPQARYVAHPDLPDPLFSLKPPDRATWPEHLPYPEPAPPRPRRKGYEPLEVDANNRLVLRVVMPEGWGEGEYVPDPTLEDDCGDIPV